MFFLVSFSGLPISWDKMTVSNKCSDNKRKNTSMDVSCFEANRHKSNFCGLIVDEANECVSK